MQFSTFLKKQLADFVEAYQKYYLKTIKITFAWTVLCFLLAAFLSAYSDFDISSKSKQISVLSYFFFRFSYKDTYSFVDVVKTIFLFFVSIFSVNLIRNQQQNDEQGFRLSNKVTFGDILYLAAILVTCIFLDCALFRLGGQLKRTINNANILYWANNIIFLLRIYIPLLLFAIIIRLRTSDQSFTYKNVLFLLVSLWLFNEVAYEAIQFVRIDIFDLILSPFTDKSYRYVIESVLGTSVIASCFLGYYCAMTAPFKMEEERVL